MAILFFEIFGSTNPTTYPRSLNPQKQRREELKTLSETATYKPTPGKKRQEFSIAAL